MSLDAIFRRANEAAAAGNWSQAERQFRALTRVKPLWAYHNLAVLYVATGRLAEAEEAFHAALAADPAGAPSRYGLGMLLLRMGRYAEGWPLYESRRSVEGLKIPRPQLAFPEWQGESLAGRHLLVIPEQGFGDQIMLSRFIAELRRRAAQVTFLCDPSLVSLFLSSGIEATPAVAAESYPTADCWTLLFSVARHLGVAPDNIDGSPYLAAPPRGAGGVGVKAAGSPTHKNNRNRSLPPKAAAQLERLGHNLDPAATGARDFLETASLIAGLDLVVTVDTSIAHLAGALGKPVRILLPAIETDWRWLEGRDDTPWYSSAQLYRQTTPGQWGPVLTRVSADLAS